MDINNSIEGKLSGFPHSTVDIFVFNTFSAEERIKFFRSLREIDYKKVRRTDEGKLRTEDTASEDKSIPIFRSVRDLGYQQLIAAYIDWLNMEENDKTDVIDLGMREDKIKSDTEDEEHIISIETFTGEMAYKQATNTTKTETIYELPGTSKDQTYSSSTAPPDVCSFGVNQYEHEKLPMTSDIKTNNRFRCIAETLFKRRKAQTLDLEQIPPETTNQNTEKQNKFKRIRDFIRVHLCCFKKNCN